MGFFNPKTTEAEWRATLPAWQRRREALREARKKGRHTDEEWQAKLAEIGHCVACGADDVPLSKDHIIPITAGGCDCIYNLQPMCDPCNSSKGARCFSVPALETVS